MWGSHPPGARPYSVDFSATTEGYAQTPSATPQRGNRKVEIKDGGYKFLLRTHLKNYFTGLYDTTLVALDHDVESRVRSVAIAS